MVDVPFLGPVLADDLARHLDTERGDATIAVDGLAFDTRGYRRALLISGTTVLAAELDTDHCGADLTRVTTGIAGSPRRVGEVAADTAGRCGRSRWWPPRRTCSVLPAARTRWPATTRKSANSTERRSVRIRPSRTYWPKAWP
ncbi:putative acyl-CoA dehydrogenase [Mycobacterium kansasii 662]|uniref:Putative acyl-CoA dehydrogenase n=1 Tax=Mycobacterium kansasii 662 TaxID=1299326 RepID=X7YFS0_MYCKA|nr:putative acyl-CoA dehydrogenase [Mycobacterium kansasii 662]